MTETPRPRSSLLMTETTLAHFVIVTYHVDPDALRKHLHARFEPDCIALADGTKRALISVVTFFDRDFRLSRMPWFKSHFGQTNYRAYVTDTETGEHVAWFFGTCLDSLSVHVPRHAWRLPWHRARMTFDCQYDEREQRYDRFRVETRSSWSPGSLAITDSGQAPTELLGFAGLERGLTLLTHPMRGFYFRRDGALGSYSIWHERMATTLAQVEVAEYGLLQSLDLVDLGDCETVHSVLMQPSIDFTIYLPPHRVAERKAR